MLCAFVVDIKIIIKKEAHPKMYLYLRLKGEKQSATATPCILMARRPFVTQTVPVLPLFAKNDILYRFLNAQTLSGSHPHPKYNKKRGTSKDAPLFKA